LAPAKSVASQCQLGSESMIGSKSNTWHGQGTRSRTTLSANCSTTGISWLLPFHVRCNFLLSVLTPTQQLLPRYAKKNLFSISPRGHSPEATFTQVICALTLIIENRLDNPRHDWKVQALINACGFEKMNMDGTPARDETQPDDTTMSDANAAQEVPSMQALRRLYFSVRTVSPETVDAWAQLVTTATIQGIVDAAGREDVYARSSHLALMLLVFLTRYPDARIPPRRTGCLATSPSAKSFSAT
jgi:hypothetical protein